MTKDMLINKLKEQGVRSAWVSGALTEDEVYVKGRPMDVVMEFGEGVNDPDNEDNPSRAFEVWEFMSKEIDTEGTDFVDFTILDQVPLENREYFTKDKVQLF